MDIIYYLKHNAHSTTIMKIGSDINLNCILDVLSHLKEDDVVFFGEDDAGEVHFAINPESPITITPYKRIKRMHFIGGCNCKYRDGSMIYRFISEEEWNAWYGDKGCVYCHHEVHSYKYLGSNDSILRVLLMHLKLPDTKHTYKLRHKCSYTGSLPIYVSDSMYQYLISDERSKCLCGFKFSTTEFTKINSDYEESLHALINFSPDGVTHRFDEKRSEWYYTYIFLLEDGKINTTTFPTGRFWTDDNKINISNTDILVAKSHRHQGTGKKTLYLRPEKHIKPINKDLYEYI